MRLKTPAQPLVFCFSDVTALCTAVQALYSLQPALPGRLALSRGRYYLCVYARLRDRQVVRRAAGGESLGPAPVLYAYYREHGLEISADAIKKLGAALAK